jgi:glyoxylase-like metal-dependent hydrolase (beta-lactamase superfamily II)
MLQIKIFPAGPLTANCMVLWEDGAVATDPGAGIPCVIVDPGFFRPEEEGMVLGFLREHGLKPDAIFLTHGHFDHTWGVASLVRKLDCPVYMGAADEPILRMHSSLLERLLPGEQVEPFAFQPATDGLELHCGGTTWQVITTPGHSPGGVCYYCASSGVLVSGDTLFAGSIGRTDLDGGDYDALMKSLRDKLLVLPGDTDVLPGHGHPTSIAREAASNPFLLPFNEPEPDLSDQDGLAIDGI